MITYQTFWEKDSGERIIDFVREILYHEEETQHCAHGENELLHTTIHYLTYSEYEREEAF